MKTTNKIIVSLGLIALSSSFAFADTTNCTYTGSGVTRGEFFKSCNAEIKAGVEKNKQAIKSNLENFKSTNGTLKDILAEASEEQLAEVKALKEELQTQISALKEEYSTIIDEAETAEEKQELRQELQSKIIELSIANLNALADIFPDNEELAEYIEKRIALYEENSSIRETTKENTKKLISERKSAKNSYNEAFLEKLEQMIDKVGSAHPEKLENMLAKIDTLIEKFEANEKLTEEEIEDIVSKLEELKEKINTYLENIDENEDEIDIESLLGA